MITVASSSNYFMRPLVKGLEHQLADYVGVNHCSCCANGTDALTFALKVWNIGPCDVV